jgi:hypothetical protein
MATRSSRNTSPSQLATFQKKSFFYSSSDKGAGEKGSHCWVMSSPSQLGKKKNENDGDQA